MKSMTGFGSAEYNDLQYNIDVEIKSINHRYRDFNFKISKKLAAFEDSIRKEISSVVIRGHIDLSVRIKISQSPDETVRFNPDVAQKYIDALSLVKQAYPTIPDNFGLKELINVEGVLTVEEQAQNPADLYAVFLPVLKQALTKLDQSREQEGERLKADFIYRISLVEGYIKQISALSDAIPKQYHEMLCQRIKDYTLKEIDEQRLITEMAIYADKASITEELVRLKSHLDSFAKMIETQGEIGRKIDFLFQEINREANTIASKSNSYPVSSLVVEIKSELEKMREQIQNIE